MKFICSCPLSHVSKTNHPEDDRFRIVCKIEISEILSPTFPLGHSSVKLHLSCPRTNL